MDVGQAKIYFSNFENEDELDDLFEGEVFKIKQFLISNFPTSKVFKAKLEKLKKLESAYTVLGGSQKNAELQSLIPVEFTESDLLDSFKSYSVILRTFRLNILKSYSVQDLERLVDLLIVETRSYAKCWRIESDELIKVPISKSPDEMSLLKNFSLSGVKNVQEVSKLNRDNELYKEAIRLSLWLKLEGNG